MIQLRKATLNKNKSTVDNIAIEIKNVDINTLISLDRLIKENKNNSTLIIDPVNERDQNFKANMPQSMDSNIHAKMQFDAFLHQSQDAFGRLKRLNIPKEDLYSVLPLSIYANATIYTSMPEIDKLESNSELSHLLNEIKNEVHSYFKPE